MELRGRFKIADIFQQIIGGLLLAGPFVVTEEVWLLARRMTHSHFGFAVLLGFLIGYATLYKADKKRDPEKEAEVAGVPLRFISLMIVSYSAVTILTFGIGVPEAFAAEPYTVVKVIGIGAIFSVIGAAAADSLF